MAQAQPVPLALVGVKPAGRVSTTLMLPLVATLPTLEGLMVKAPVLLPSPKLLGVWVLLMARSGTAPGSSAKLLLALPVVLPDRLMPVMRLVMLVGLPPVPPAVPAVVVPLLVPAGWLPWV